MASIFIRDTLHGLQTRFAFRRIIDTMDACNDFGSNERIVSIVIESKMGKTWPGSGYNFNPRFYVALLLHNLYFYYFQYPSNFSNFVKIRPIPHSKSRGARFSSFPSIQLRLPLRVARVVGTSSRALGWVTKRIIGTVADRTNSNFLAAWSDLYIINLSPIYHRSRDNYSKVYPYLTPLYPSSSS